MTPRSPDFITDFDNEASREPLRNIYTADGSQLLSAANNGNKEEGSSYFAFRHDLQKMVQERLLDGGNEINSNNPKTITDFLKVALTSCVANNSNEFMLTFSSHGAGYGGFGGDDNTRRRLTASNASIKGAIQAALSSVAGAPAKLDVLGFDACLMQGFGAIDDYHSITKYYLASEAVEPGHGWRYNALTDTSSALNLSKQIVSTFTQSLHGFPEHDNPKTLAVVDTSKYGQFLNAMEAMFALLHTSVASSSSNDPNIWAHISRSHKLSVKFMAYGDRGGSQSALDIGSFLATFQAQCNPTPELATAISTALTAYNNQFVERQNGPQTPMGTDMAILWPRKAFYQQGNLDEALFDDAKYVTSTAPNYLAFLKAYLQGNAPLQATGTSVCQTSTETESSPDKPGGMMSGTRVDNNAETMSGTRVDNNAEGHRLSVCVATEASARTDEIVAEFGINFALESSEETRRKLESMVDRRSQMLLSDSGRRAMLRQQNQPTSALHHRNHHHYGFSPETTSRRRMQGVDEDYLLLFGGEVPGSYSGSSFSACWNRKFFLIEDTNSNTAEEVYAFDQGEGARDIPLIYFPATTDSSVLNMDFFDAEDAYARGGKPAFATFSVIADTGEARDNLVVFVRDPDAGSSFAQQPKDGGWILPIIFVEAFINGEDIYEIVGGFGNTALAWDNSTNIRMKTLTDAEYFDLFETSDDPAGPLLIDVIAYDLDVSENDTDVLGIEFASVNIEISGTDTTHPTCKEGETLANGYFECGTGAFCVAERSECLFEDLGDETCEAACKCLDGFSGSQCTDTNECATNNPCPTDYSFCVDYDPPQKFKYGCLDGFTTVLPEDDAAELNFYGSVDAVPLEWRPVACI